MVVPAPPIVLKGEDGHTVQLASTRALEAGSQQGRIGGDHKSSMGRAGVRDVEVLLGRSEVGPLTLFGANCISTATVLRAVPSLRS